MLIGVDLDDVLADFIPALAKFHNDTYGTSLTKGSFHSYEFAKVWGGTLEEAIDKVKIFWELYHDSLKPVFGSVGAVKKLKENNELIIITSRQDKFGLGETKKWIENYFANCFSDVYYAFNHWIREEGNKTKSELCLDLKVDVLIDDNVEYAVDCAGKGIKVLLLDAPYNQCDELPKEVTRVKSWKEIVDVINKK